MEEEFDHDFEFFNNELSLQAINIKTPIVPNVQRNTKEIVLVRLSDLAQFGITVNEIQESGMIFDPNGNKWVLADEAIEPEGIDLTGFDPSIHSNESDGRGWDDEFGFQEKSISPKNILSVAKPMIESKVEDDVDMDGFDDDDDFEDKGHSLKIGNLAMTSSTITTAQLNCSEVKKLSLSPKNLNLQTKLQQYSENYDCDFGDDDDDDNTSHELSILIPSNIPQKQEEPTDNEAKVSDFLKNLRLNSTNQSGPRLIRPEDVNSLLQASNVKQLNTNKPEITTLPSRTNMTISTLSDPLDDFDDLLDDIPPQSNNLNANLIKNKKIQKPPTPPPSNRPASRGSISFGGSTHEDTLSDRDITGNIEEVENWDDGFDVPDQILSIHTIQANQNNDDSNNCTPNEILNVNKIQPLPTSLLENKKGKKGHHKKMKLFTIADMDINKITKDKNSVTRIQENNSTSTSSSSQLLMTFDPKLQKWVNNMSVDVSPLDEVNWDDEDELDNNGKEDGDLEIHKSSSSQLSTPLSLKNTIKKIDLGLYVDSLDDIDLTDNSLKSHSGSTIENQERERISTMADFRINMEVVRNCQHEHEVIMLGFLGEDEYSRLMHGGTKSTNRISIQEKHPPSSLNSSSTQKIESQTKLKSSSLDIDKKISHQFKQSRGGGESSRNHEEEGATKSPPEEKERTKRRKTPPRIRVNSNREPQQHSHPIQQQQQTPSHPLLHQQPSQMHQQQPHHPPPPPHLTESNSTKSNVKPNLKSTTTPQGSALGHRKRKVLQDIWKLYEGSLPLTSQYH